MNTIKGADGGRASRKRTAHRTDATGEFLRLAKNAAEMADKIMLSEKPGGGFFFHRVFGPSSPAVVLGVGTRDVLTHTCMHANKPRSGFIELAALDFTAPVVAMSAASPDLSANPESAPIPPVHPGEILAEEFLVPLGLTAISVAKLVNVPRTRIERLLAGQTSMTPDTALRLERLFGASAQFWLNLQAAHDLSIARLEAPDLDAIKPYQATPRAAPTAHG